MAVVVAERRLDLTHPIPRSVPLGGMLTIRGSLAAGFSASRLIATHPTGRTGTKHLGSDSAFDTSIRLISKGRYQIELLAESASRGTTVIANFPVFVGTTPNSVPTGEPSSSPSAATATPARVENVLLELLQTERRKAGLKPLATHDKLTALARAHSLDMATNGFFGHRSKRTGSPDDRLRSAGVRTRLVRENCGRGANGRTIHHDFLRSPGHRAVLLDPRVSHVGIGVAAHPDGFLVTQLMVKLPK